ncbi:hypothetical protein O0235_10105 [Tepidiforma flava]|uniref:Uncharacterized protein n=1 Tax=Tepidiforma flava TaxID=3004094 RepID=A0ABY7M563_9CHLR|nr:hypothetical protein [Tepidiforma flava]WBL35140.1 hypothetical protein O0235_10105 [Tepidiforma flava]
MAEGFAELGDAVGGDAVDAPVGELLGAVEVVDGPGDDGEAAAAELLDDGAGEEGVAAGDAAREGVALGDAEEEVELGADVDGVEEVDCRQAVVEGAEDGPGLGGGDDRGVVLERGEEVADGLGGAVAAVFEVEEDAGAGAGGEVEQLFEAKVGGGEPFEVPVFRRGKGRSGCGARGGLRSGRGGARGRLRGGRRGPRGRRRQRRGGCRRRGR